MRIVRTLASGAGSLKDLDKTFSLSGACCNAEKDAIKAWRRVAEEGIRAIGRSGPAMKDKRQTRGLVYIYVHCLCS